MLRKALVNDYYNVLCRVGFRPDDPQSANAVNLLVNDKYWVRSREKQVFNGLSNPKPSKVSRNKEQRIHLECENTAFE